MVQRVVIDGWDFDRAMDEAQTAGAGDLRQVQVDRQAVPEQRPAVRRGGCRRSRRTPGLQPPSAAADAASPIVLVLPVLAADPRARRLSVPLRDLRLVHRPGGRQRRRVDRASTTSATSPDSATFGAAIRNTVADRARHRRAEARDRARPGAAGQPAPPGPRHLPGAPDAALGDAGLRRLPHLARALPADRRRHQPGPDADRHLARHRSTGSASATPRCRR